MTARETLSHAKAHLPEIAQQYDLELSEVAENLENLPLTIYEEETYRNHVKQAAVLIGWRDATDVPLLALALALRIPVWSNDNDFRETKLPVKVFPTKDLLPLLGLHVPRDPSRKPPPGRRSPL